MDPQTYRITEVAPGVFGMLLAPCSCQVLSHVLVPLASSTVWLVAYHPIGSVEWRDIALPLTSDAAPRKVRARLPRYDLQFALPDFLDLLPEMHAPAGMLAIQLSRPVPDTLVMEHLTENPNRHRILEQNGWLLSFDLPHDGAYAWIESPDRARLEAILALPILESGELP